MEAVFLGGSRRIARLDDKIRSRLDALLDRDLWMFVGDANGADRALQQYLAERGYHRVVVYAVTGALRNNVGEWEVRHVDAPHGARGFDRYSVKDRQMARDASYGFMLWDGKSRGTLANVRSLLALGKPVAVHLGPARRLVSLTSPDDLAKLGVSSTDERLRQRNLLVSAPEGVGSEAREAHDQGPSRSRVPRSRRRRAVRDHGHG